MASERNSFPREAGLVSHSTAKVELSGKHDFLGEAKNYRTAPCWSSVSTSSTVLSIARFLNFSFLSV